MAEPSLTERPTRRRWRPTVLVLLVALVAGLFGAFITTSFSQGFGPLWHVHYMMGGPLSPAEIEDRADRMVRHLGIEIDATAEQQSKLQGIVKGAVKDLLPMREQAMAARQQARDLLTQTTIDRGAIEKLRATQIAAADAFSKRVAQALGDAAEVLTPDQRKKINDFLPSGGSRWRPWQRG